MNKKTQQIIMRTIVMILVIGLILSILTPFLSAATEYTTYTNKNLHMSMKVPSNAKNNIKKTGPNGVEITVNFNYLIRITYGDIYKDTIDILKLNEDVVDRSEFYIGSSHFKKTWNTKKYVEDYFKDVFTGNKNDKYTFTITKTTLDGIEAWRCKYKNKALKSSGYYYLTINNAGLYILQYDAYLENISKYATMTNKMKESFKISDKVDPQKTDKKKNKKEQQEKNNEDIESNEQAEQKNNYANFVVAGIGVVILGISVYFYTKQRKYKKMKKNREEYRKRKRNKKS